MSGVLGVLGGMGPMATVDFITKVVQNTPATSDQEHIQMIVCSATKIPDRTAAILADGPDPFPAMCDALRKLELGGATCIGIPCNTAHYWHSALQSQTDVPILHIVDAVAEQCAITSAQSGPIGIMATDGTVRAGIYQRQLSSRGFDCVTPAPDSQAEIMRAIRLVKAGYFAEATAILKAEASELHGAGCSSVVMACTEIPIALARSNSEREPVLIDPTSALAIACVKACLGTISSCHAPL